jgi:hypothetical protein
MNESDVEKRGIAETFYKEEDVKLIFFDEIRNELWSQVNFWPYHSIFTVNSLSLAFLKLGRIDIPVPNPDHFPKL